MLSDRLTEAMLGLSQVPTRPIHGAFRLSQLLVSANGMGLIDFDSCARGSPAFDAGSFVAYLVYLRHKRKLAPERSLACIRSFYRAYAESAPWGA